MPLATIQRQFEKLLACKRALGFGAALKLALYYKTRHVPWKLFSLRIPGIRYPVYCRTGSSDPWVVKQIFVEGEYAPLDAEHDVRVVFDCGANVGYSSLYFLNRFPKCRVVAVEPDPDNIRLLRINLRPYENRMQIVEAGVWSTDTRLVIVRSGEAWTTQVRAATRDEKGDVLAVDIANLMQRMGVNCVDILKVDIEGSEAEVFSANVESWLPCIRSLAIELHGQRCADIVEGALTHYRFRKVLSGDMSFFLDLERRAATDRLNKLA